VLGTRHLTCPLLPDVLNKEICGGGRGFWLT
jgi:hypothetical protein